MTTALAFGWCSMALAYAIGPISGAHVNPAVTLGFLAAGRMKLTEAIGYVVAQVAGATPGPPSCGRSSPTSRATTARSKGWAPTATEPAGPSLHMKPDRRVRHRGHPHLRLRDRDPLRHPQGGHSGGGRLGHRDGAGRGPPDRHPPDGTSVNPARSLGPALIVGGTALSQVWLFLDGPPGGPPGRRHLCRRRAPVDRRSGGHRRTGISNDGGPLPSRRWNSTKASASSGPATTAS